eukprot:CAMPEP_0204059128 /NCGR_PEP_ID=MMETSP0360-20130528/137238_1 /ASSEMBLY_ACC=CAM_ASM_000342 /TAXON_ID=268821 /ORGANISM="Scrippsiella Hangoei, Strain SHTV-5" /LENGTH=60 /DNA_ID=CAMNT_0051006709 /DNA_START=48 /DNA_END=228 /DNA_ORIENTATION=+
MAAAERTDAHRGTSAGRAPAAAGGVQGSLRAGGLQISTCLKGVSPLMSGPSGVVLERASV